MTKRLLLSVAMCAVMTSAGSAQDTTGRQDDETKLVVQSIELFPNPTPQGFRGSVVVELRRTAVPSPVTLATFSVNVAHARDSQDALSQVKGEVDKLADQLKDAARRFEPPH